MMCVGCKAIWGWRMSVVGGLHCGHGGAEAGLS